MKLTEVKDQTRIETRTVYTFKHKGKKLYYSCTTSNSGSVIDEGIFDLNWKEVHDEILLDKIICSLWPKSNSLEKILQEK